MKKNEKFRVILRTIPDVVAQSFQYVAVFPDVKATPGRIAFMTFKIVGGKLIPTMNEEMALSYYCSCTKGLKKTICEAYFAPHNGIFDLVKEYLESDPDPVVGKVVLRYRLPDLAKSAWF